MSEGINNNFNKKENFDFSKLIQPVIKKAKEQIESYKTGNQSLKDFDILKDKIDSESTLFILKSEEIQKAHNKNVEVLLPQMEKEILDLFSKSSAALLQVADAQAVAMKDKTFDILLEKREESEKILNELMARPEYENDLPYKLLIIKLMEHVHSLAQLVGSVDTDKKQARSQYRDYILSHHDDIKEQIRNKEESVKKMDKNSFEAVKVEYKKLADELTFNCIEIIREAENLYKQNEAQKN
jgi:hypothetical protein